jgi:hypothetical protein
LCSRQKRECKLSITGLTKTKAVIREMRRSRMPQNPMIVWAQEPMDSLDNMIFKQDPNTE